MKILINNKKLLAQAKNALCSSDLCPKINNLIFDPSKGLPPINGIPCKLPTFIDLFEIIPDEYIRPIEVAYIQMSQFAENWWSPVSGVVNAQPFFEWMMHSDVFNKHYRDHITHQLRVAAIGDILLSRLHRHGKLLATVVKYIENDEYLKDLACDVGGMEELLGCSTETFVRVAWWFTALFHDCGYPLQFHTDYFSKLNDAFNINMGGPGETSWFPCFSRLAELTGGL